MKNLLKNINEHLKTYKKYRTLKNAYDTLLKEYQDRTTERDVQIIANKKIKKHFDKELDKLLEENIKLKNELKQAKKK